jgi:hypothetical protein
LTAGDGRRPVEGARYTDSVTRVYAVVAQHPHISVEWPRWSGRKEYRAHWPEDPDDPDSAIRSVQERNVERLAAALEEEFPPGA